MAAQIIDLWNQALSEAGARAKVDDINENSKEANACRIHYDPLRRAILRSAPWACTRQQATLNVDGQYTDTSNDTYPYGYTYLYPQNCLFIRYVIPGPVDPSGNPIPGPWPMPSRASRFLPALSASGNYQILYSNVQNALAVFSFDQQNVDLFDAGLWDGLVAALASRLIVPLGGKLSAKTAFEQIANLRVNVARAADGNEAKPTTDHTPDWIATRGYSPIIAITPGFNEFGFWYVPYQAGTGWGD